MSGIDRVEPSLSFTPAEYQWAFNGPEGIARNSRRNDHGSIWETPLSPNELYKTGTRSQKN